MMWMIQSTCAYMYEVSTRCTALQGPITTQPTPDCMLASCRIFILGLQVFAPHRMEEEEEKKDVAERRPEETSGPFSTFTALKYNTYDGDHCLQALNSWLIVRRKATMSCRRQQQQTTAKSHCRHRSETLSWHLFVSLLSSSVTFCFGMNFFFPILNFVLE